MGNFLSGKPYCLISPFRAYGAFGFSSCNFALSSHASSRKWEGRHAR